MTITAEATVENGQLKLKHAIALPQGTAVRVTITPVDDNYDPLDAVIGIGESGCTDGAAQHDHYIYGTPKR
ncbi:MAG: antitoxin family protein [Planctomycetaceae bacterium]